MMDYLSKLTGWLKKHWVDVKSNWRNTDDPMALGLAWSKAFVALLLLLAFVRYSSGDVGWELKIWTLIKAPPNEIGDTLAGIAGTLAFLWIIVTVQLQSRELKAQREELELARNEYSKMAAAQDKQVDAMNQQIEYLRAERNDVEEAAAGALLSSRIEGVAELLVSSKLGVVELEIQKNASQRKQQTRVALRVGNQVHGKENVIMFAVNSIRGALRNIDLNQSKGMKYVNRKVTGTGHEELLNLLDDIDSDVENLSRADRQRLENLQITSLRSDLLRLLEGEEFQ